LGDTNAETFENIVAVAYTLQEEEFLTIRFNNFFVIKNAFLLRFKLISARDLHEVYGFPAIMFLIASYV
jgi:hypothetical protein